MLDTEFVRVRLIVFTRYTKIWITATLFLTSTQFIVLCHHLQYFRGLFTVPQDILEVKSLLLAWNFELQVIVIPDTLL